MPWRGHREEKIVYALRQVESGKKVTTVNRRQFGDDRAVSAGC
jgi:hypothetical protein